MPFNLFKPNVEKMKGKRDIVGLIKRLSNKDTQVRQAAAQALGVIKDAKAVEPLIEALKDESCSVREEAAKALGKIKDSSAVVPLTHALKDEDSHVRRSAAHALEKIHPHRTDEKALPRLKEGPTASKSKLTLARKLIKEIMYTVDLRQRADEIEQERLEKLINLGPDVIPLAASAIESSIGSHAGHEYNHAGQLCTAIGRIGGQAASDLLLKYFSLETHIWEYELIRAGAARGLGYLGGSQVIATLSEYLKKGAKTDEVSNAIIESLERLGVKPPLTIDTLVKDFIESELVKGEPDFKRFPANLIQFPKTKRAVAWWQLGWAIREDKGDEEKAQKCFVKALTLHAARDFAAWSSLRPEIEWAERSTRTIEKLKQKVGVIVDD